MFCPLRDPPVVHPWVLSLAPSASGRHSTHRTGENFIVANPLAGGLTRVTIVAPRGQADLALPSGVALASLLPVLLTQTGTDVRAGGPDNGWALSRLGG